MPWIPHYSDAHFLSRTISLSWAIFWIGANCSTGIGVWGWSVASSSYFLYFLTLFPSFLLLLHQQAPGLTHNQVSNQVSKYPSIQVFTVPRDLWLAVEALFSCSRSIPVWEWKVLRYRCQFSRIQFYFVTAYHYYTTTTTVLQIQFPLYSIRIHESDFIIGNPASHPSLDPSSYLFIWLPR